MFTNVVLVNPKIAEMSNYSSKISLTSLHKPLKQLKGESLVAMSFSSKAYQVLRCSLCNEDVQAGSIDVMEFHFHQACANEVSKMLQQINNFEVAP